MKSFPLVILHGWGLSKKRFEPLTNALQKKKYTVYALDFPGFGETAIPSTPMTLADYAEFLDGFVKKNSIKNPVFIGHSFGGRVALKYQQLFPGKTKALILTGTPGFTPVARKKLALFVGVAKLGKLLFSIPGLSLVQDSVRRWYYYLVGAKEFYRAEGAMRQTFKNIVQERLEPCMACVTVSTFLVWGALDQITPVWIAHKMHETIKGAKLEILPDVGHGVPFKEPDVFVKAIEPFLATV